MPRFHVCALGALLLTTAACTVDVADPVGDEDMLMTEQGRNAGSRPGTPVATGNVPAPCTRKIFLPLQDELYADLESVYESFEDPCTGATVQINVHFSDFAAWSGSIVGVMVVNDDLSQVTGAWKADARGEIVAWIEGATSNGTILLEGKLKRDKLQPKRFEGTITVP